MVYTCGMYSGFDGIFFGGIIFLAIIIGVVWFIVVGIEQQRKSHNIN